MLGHGGHGDHDGGHEHHHVHGTATEAPPDTLYHWQIRHPFEGIADRVAVEVSPRNGLLPRWRFVVPADYEGVVTWGVAPPGADSIDHSSVRRPVSEGPVQLQNGPEVVWMGGHKPLSPTLSAVLVFEGDPPHYLAFGQAETPGGPPMRLEGVYFQSHAHP